MASFGATNIHSRKVKRQVHNHIGSVLPVSEENLQFWKYTQADQRPPGSASNNTLTDF